MEQYCRKLTTKLVLQDFGVRPEYLILGMSHFTITYLERGCIVAENE